MPEYAWLLESKAEIDAIPQRMRGMRMLGVPYTDEEIEHGMENAQKQAKEIAAKIKEYGSPEQLADKRVIALIAYLEKLGRDISATGPAAATARPRPRRRLTDEYQLETPAMDRRSPADGLDGRGAGRLRGDRRLDLPAAARAGRGRRPVVEDDEK